jgi:hypothetical protein
MTPSQFKKILAFTADNNGKIRRMARDLILLDRYNSPDVQAEYVKFTNYVSEWVKSEQSKSQLVEANQ